jgi:Rhs element Vgr protein
MPESRILPTRAETDLSTVTILSNGTEVGGDIGIDSIFVVKQVNKIPSARITIIDGSVSKEDFTVSSGSLFVPGAEIEIKAGYHADEETIFKGVIVRHSIRTKRDRTSFLIVDVKDKSTRMTLGRKSRYFAEMLDSEVFGEIIGNYDLESDIEATRVTHPEMVQLHATDWDFLVSRAEVNGQLVLVNDGKVTVKAPDVSSAPVVTLAYGHNIIDYEAGMDARDQCVTVSSRTWDSSSQSVIDSEAEEPGFQEPGNIPGSELAGLIGPDALPQRHTGRIADDELKAWSDARLLRSRLAKIQGKVKIQGISAVKAGDMIEFAGFGERFNGVAFVSSIAHRFSSSAAWVTDIEFGLEQRRFVDTYDDIIDRQAGGLIPAVHGLQIGVVTAMHDDPDGEHRVRVRLPVIDNENDGVWARLASKDAGEKRGWVFFPEVGDEVIVGFLDDDPRYPVILGSLFSSAKSAPLPATEENNEKGFVTKSGMKLVFDDGKVSVSAETPKGNKIMLSQESGSIVVNDENGNKLELTPDGITMSSPGNVSITASGDVTIKGANISVSAQAQFKAEGSAGAEMSTSGQAVVKGSIVMIN